MDYKSAWILTCCIGWGSCPCNPVMMESCDFCYRKSCKIHTLPLMDTHMNALLSNNGLEGMTLHLWPILSLITKMSFLTTQSGQPSKNGMLKRWHQSQDKNSRGIANLAWMFTQVCMYIYIQKEGFIPLILYEVSFHPFSDPEHFVCSIWQLLLTIHYILFESPDKQIVFIPKQAISMELPVCTYISDNQPNNLPSFHIWEKDTIYLIRSSFSFSSVLVILQRKIINIHCSTIYFFLHSIVNGNSMQSQRKRISKLWVMYTILDNTKICYERCFHGQLNAQWTLQGWWW